MNTPNSTHPEKNRFERRFPPFDRSLLTQRRIIIVSHVAIAITILVVSRRDTAHYAVLGCVVFMCFRNNAFCMELRSLFVGHA
jgi:hypothetical protein